MVKEKSAYKKDHLAEKTWKIYLPVVFSSCFIFFVMILIGVSTFTGSMDSERWGQISTIWLVFVVGIIGVIIFFSTIGFIFIIVKMIQGLPSISNTLFGISNVIKSFINKSSNLMVYPIIQTQSIWTGFIRLIHMILNLWKYK